MKKRILRLFCLTLLFCMLLGCLTVHALESIDPEREATLTLYYTKNDLYFSNMEIRIFRVAEAHPDGSFDLIPPYSGYPINIHGITSQTEWDEAADTLEAYIAANQVPPTQAAYTDEAGTVHFSELKPGLYFVSEARADTKDSICVFRHFLIYLPTPRDDGSYLYDTEAKPKGDIHLPPVEYTVTKLWKDGNHASDRPAEISVGVYLDGVLQETLLLNASNNWTASWQVSGEQTGKWTVAELNIPQPYSVSIVERGSAFTIINTYPSDPETPPDTGDDFALLPWILTMCISGCLLLILGIHREKGKL